MANVFSTSSGHLFVTDRVSKRLYLIDTGSNICVFPRKLLLGRRERIDYDLYAANGTTIPTHGWTSQTLNLGLRRHFSWRFVVADIQTPIIGVDLLSFYGLLVDCRHNRLLDGVTSPHQGPPHLHPSPVSTSSREAHPQTVSYRTSRSSRNQQAPTRMWGSTQRTTFAPLQAHQ